MLTATRLAEFHDVSAPYLTKHLQALVRAGICESEPGPTGGFRLARPAEDVTVLDVALAVDGEERAFRCTEIRQRGPASRSDPKCYPSACSIAQLMWRAEDAWRQELGSVTIADIAGSLAETVNHDQLLESAAWLDAVLSGRGRQPADRPNT